MKKKRVFVRISALAIAALLVAGFILSAALFTKYSIVRAVRGASAGESVQSDAYTTARAMCTVEASTGRILYEKNGTDPLPMASTTKVITAITVLENCDDIDTPIEIDSRAVGVGEASMYLQKGEKLTVRELLLGLMLRSGNDAAAALALYISPPADKTSRAQIFDNFSAKMSETAVKAGAANSQFKNPHGLDQDGHYTTARDLALVSAYAMRNPTFAEIVATKDARVSGVEYPRVMKNKNRLLNMMDTCVGVKTGFTKKAGRCYVGAATSNGMTVVCVVLNCGPMFEETAALMEQADDEFTMRRILSIEHLFDCGASGAQGIPRENFYYPLHAGENVKISCEGDEVKVHLNDELIYSGKYNRVNTPRHACGDATPLV